MPHPNELGTGKGALMVVLSSSTSKSLAMVAGRHQGWTGVRYSIAQCRRYPLFPRFWPTYGRCRIDASEHWFALIAFSVVHSNSHCVLKRALVSTWVEQGYSSCVLGHCLPSLLPRKSWSPSSIGYRNWTPLWLRLWWSLALPSPYMANAIQRK